MSNPLIDSRDAFAASHPEQRIDLNGREWGLVEVGSGPVLLLIPGTLGRGDIFWQQITALKDRMRILAVTYPSTGGVADWSSDLVTLMDRSAWSGQPYWDRRWVDIWRSILRPTHLHG
jgi:maspardin